MKKVLIITIVLLVIIIGFCLNQYAPNEAGYETVSLTFKK